MTDFITISRPYAKAAFDFAKEQNSIDDWQNWLNLATLISQDETIKSTLCSDIKPDSIANLIINLCKNNINQHQANFIKIMAENKRLALLPYVLTIFNEYHFKNDSITEVSVCSACTLTAEQLNSITSKMEQKLNTKVKLNCSIDKSIISGFIIRANDMIIDSSLKGRLSRLTDAIQS